MKLIKIATAHLMVSHFIEVIQGDDSQHMLINEHVIIDYANLITDASPSPQINGHQIDFERTAKEKCCKATEQQSQKSKRFN